MKIYRVERYDGEGPFGSFTNQMNCRLPGPQHDMGFPEDFEIDTNLIFGCRNKKLMKRWIKDAMKLATHGFVVNEYAIDKQKVISGAYQSMFHPDDAVFVKKHSIILFKHA